MNAQVMTGYCLFYFQTRNFFFETALRVHGKITTTSLLTKKVITVVPPPQTRTQKGNEKFFELAGVRVNRSWCQISCNFHTHYKFHWTEKIKILKKEGKKLDK